MALHTILRVRLWVFAVLIVMVSISSCNNNSYPCPGLGRSSEADMNMFDENGVLKNPKNSKSRRSKDNGLVHKKSPKKIRAPRKTHI